MRVIAGGRVRHRKRRSHKLYIVIGIMIVLLILVCVYFYIRNEYRITAVEVEGNTYHTDEEIKGYVLTGAFGDNSLYLSHAMKKGKEWDIPFVDTVEIEIVSHHEITIQVYEKMLSGCVEHLGRYIYFDKDGVVVESTKELSEKVPLITGLEYKQIVMYKQLPVSKEEVFSTIFNLTKLMDKYNLKADRIHFDPDYNITAYFGQVRASLGQAEYLDEKLMNIQYILPSLEGMSGELRVENYTNIMDDIDFKKD